MLSIQSKYKPRTGDQDHSGSHQYLSRKSNTDVQAAISRFVYTNLEKGARKGSARTTRFFWLSPSRGTILSDILKVEPGDYRITFGRGGDGE